FQRLGSPPGLTPAFLTRNWQMVGGQVLWRSSERIERWKRMREYPAVPREVDEQNSHRFETSDWRHANSLKLQARSIPATKMCFPGLLWPQFFSKTMARCPNRIVFAQCETNRWIHKHKHRLYKHKIAANRLAWSQNCK